MLESLGLMFETRARTWGVGSRKNSTDIVNTVHCSECMSAVAVGIYVWDMLQDHGDIVLVKAGSQQRKAVQGSNTSGSVVYDDGLDLFMTFFCLIWLHASCDISCTAC